MRTIAPRRGAVELGAALRLDERLGISGPAFRRGRAQIGGSCTPPWLSSAEVTGALAPSTKVSYRWLYNRNIAGRISKRQLRSLRPDTIRSWYGEVVTAAS
jgi:hypothetical protein